MKIKNKHFFYGAALAQIAEYPTFTSINKFTDKDGLYIINDDKVILIKYSDAEEGVWRFTFRKDDFDKEIYDNYHFSLVLICGDSTICLLRDLYIESLLDIDLLYDTDSSQSINVNFPENGQMRVKGSKGKVPRMVPHNSFPRDLFAHPTEMAWPPFCRMNFYSGHPNLVFSSEDRMLDLADTLPYNMPNSGRTVYLGLSTICHEWKTWNNVNLRKIEKHIKYDLGFDGYKVKLTRISKTDPKWKKCCSQEFIWELDISEQQ